MIPQLISHAKSRPKIIHILYSGLGGHGADFFSLSSLHEKEKFEFVAIFFGIENVNPSFIAKCLVFQIRYYFCKKIKYELVKSMISIFSTLKKEKPNIICLYGLSSLPAVLTYKLFYPKVKLITRDTQAPNLKSKREWALLKIGFLLTDKTIFLTDVALESFKKKSKSYFNKSKALVIPNGVDTQIYQDKFSGIMKEKIVIGMQSRLQLIKDHPTLLRAFKELNKIFPEKTIILKIAGDGETLDSLKKLSVELGIDKVVHFTGLLDEAELLRFMAELDIYVQATFGEALSTSILQAMACGLPIVASNVEGVNNLINDNYNGMLYVSEDHLSLLEKLSFLIYHPNFTKKLSSNARIESEEKFSNHKMANNYEKVFVSIMKNRL